MSLPLALSDMDISAHLMEWTPLHVRVGMDGKLNDDNPGILVNIMDQLATRGAFRWRDSFGVGLVPGNDVGSNATFSEILTWAVDTYDVSIGEWRNSVSRKGSGVSFPFGIADASLIMVQKEKNTAFNPFLYLSTFTVWVWVAIVATYIISGFVYLFIDYYGEGEHFDRSILRRRVVMYDSFMALCQQNHFAPQSNAGRIFTFSINFFSLVIIASYTANLVTLMVMGQTPTYVAYSFREAELNQVPICVWKDTSAHRHLRYKYPDAILVEADSRDLEYEYLNAGLCDIVSDTMQSWRGRQRNKTLNGDCSLALVGSPDVIQKAGFAVKGVGARCSSLLTDVLDYHLSDMNVEDALEKQWKTHLDLISNDFCTYVDADEDVMKLDMKDLGGIFITHGVLVAVALIMCQFEHQKKLKVKKKSKIGYKPKNVPEDEISQSEVKKESSNGYSDKPKNDSQDKTSQSETEFYDQRRSILEQFASPASATTPVVAAFTKIEMREMLEQFKDQLCAEISAATASNRLPNISISSSSRPKLGLLALESK